MECLFVCVCGGLGGRYWGWGLGGRDVDGVVGEWCMFYDLGLMMADCPVIIVYG